MSTNRELIGLIEFILAAPAIMQEVGMDSIKKQGKEIAGMNVKQMQAGVAPDGTAFRDYSQASVEAFGKEPGPIKWRHTGNFHKSVLVRQQGKDLFMIDATDPKYENYIKPDTDPLGLTSYYLEDVADQVFQDVWYALLIEIDRKL